MHAGHPLLSSNIPNDVKRTTSQSVQVVEYTTAFQQFQIPAQILGSDGGHQRQTISNVLNVIGQYQLVYLFELVRRKCTAVVLSFDSLP